MIIFNINFIYIQFKSINIFQKNVFQQAIRFNATSSGIPKVPMYIDGKFVESKTNDWIDVHNPATNEVSFFFIILNNTF